MARVIDGATGLPVSEQYTMDAAWREFSTIDYTAGVIA